MTGWVALMCAAGWLIGWLIGWSKRLPASDRADAVSVTVIVPARNEAERIGPLLAVVASAGIDVIVVDDGSTDATAVLAAAAGATVAGVERAPGWTGKAWACWSGATAARGDVLVFLDADTVATPSAIRQLARRAAASGGLVSVQPHHRIARWHEYFSALPNLVAVMGAGTGRAPRGSRWRGPAAFGMAMAIPRRIYFDVGGHSVRPSAVIDDLALAATVHEAGAPVETWCGGADISVRMYAEGVGQLVRGWTKNLVAGARSIPILRTLAVTLWIATLAQSCVAMLTSLASGHVSAVATVVYLAFAVQASILAARVGSFGIGTLVALPVLTAGFMALFLASAVGSVFRKSVSWRGRAVEVGAMR